MSPFERLVAWREAYQLALAVYRDTESFPKQERFGLTAQVRRAAISVPANIAEGCVKRGPAEFRRYLDIARGSLAELQCLLRLARDLGYLEQSAWEELERRVNRTGYLSWRLYDSMNPGGRKKKTVEA